jgi:superfamily II DNA or RNA helicase
MSNSSTQNYIDFKVNGRLFPLWILYNFKKYNLKPIVKIPGQDPCKTSDKDEVLELRSYQKFIGAYLDYRSPYRDILLYHGLGSGKTASAINVYNVLYNYTPGWNVFILIKASLKNKPWLDDLKTWLAKEDNAGRWDNIKFIHYDSPKADRDFLNKVKEADSSKKNLYIFDEAHNFIRNVYGNITNKQGKRAQVIYDYIVQDKKENDSSRVILISATPAVNTPFELALIFNLLRADTFPNNEAKFNELYVGSTGQLSLNPANKNMFQRRIIGLVSYYKGATSDLYAKKVSLQKNLIMDDYQLQVYNFFEDIEKKLEANKKPGKKSGQSVYRSYTRQASNFVFPVMGTDMSGEGRPRPSKFRLSEKEAEKLLEGKTDYEIDKDLADRYQLYLDTMDRYISTFDSWLANRLKEDEKQGLSLEKDMDVFKIEYKYKFNDFWKNYKQKSNLLRAMYECSCKMTAIMFYSLRSPGTLLVYSNYVKMEGLQVFKIYMKYFGYTEFGKEPGIDFHRYTEFSGSMDKELRNSFLNAFNDSRNKDGSKIRIILISPAGSEGISLKNVRQVHVMEPYWNEVRIEQLIGRAIRQCSHKDIPIDERYVEVYRYNAISSENVTTTDQEIQELALEKSNLIDSFLLPLKEIAVDCELFKEHNMIDGEYHCFKFNEKSYFDQYIAPAYKDDIYYDKKIDNGSNSINSVIKKIRAIRIKAVTDDDGQISEPIDCWYNPDTGIVYDFELKYPFAKVKKNGELPVKVDKNTYLLDQIIVIPKIRKN